eukprot:gene16555-22603_t
MGVICSKSNIDSPVKDSKPKPQIAVELSDSTKLKEQTLEEVLSPIADTTDTTTSRPQTNIEQIPSTPSDEEEKSSDPNIVDVIDSSENLNIEHKKSNPFQIGDKVYYRPLIESRYCWIAAVVNSINDDDSTLELGYDKLGDWYGNPFVKLKDPVAQNAIDDMKNANQEYVFPRWELEFDDDDDDECFPLNLPLNPIANLQSETKRFEGFAGANQENYGPEMWGMTMDQLLDILKDERYTKNMTMYDVVKTIVMPETKGKGVGYSLLKNRNNPLRVRVMISHAWTESYFQFVSAIRESQVEGPYWICAFAIYQPEDIPEVSIAKQLGNDPMRGPFATVLNQKETELMLAVITEQCDIYTRLWCVLEIFVAIQVKLPVQITTYSRTDGISSTDRLYHNAISQGADIAVDSQRARCGDPTKPPNMDEITIRAAIESVEGGYATIDRVAEWVKFNALVGIFKLRPWAKETSLGSAIGMRGPSGDVKAQLSIAMGTYMQQLRFKTKKDS